MSISKPLSSIKYQTALLSNSIWHKRLDNALSPAFSSTTNMSAAAMICMKRKRPENSNKCSPRFKPAPFGRILSWNWIWSISLTTNITYQVNFGKSYLSVTLVLSSYVLSQCYFNYISLTFSDNSSARTFQIAMESYPILLKCQNIIRLDESIIKFEHLVW
jgi:hypothetical protein